ncbi:MAG: alpha/beta hydrolase-fold protein [Clostridiaceae bacterium]
MRQENLLFDFYDGSKRKVRVLLPDNYKESKKKYSVLYMFDGQNLFNKKDSYAGVTWGVREELKKLTKINKDYELIVVGIDHAGEERLNEYSIFDYNFHGVEIESWGIEFLDYMVNDLIPVIEKKYRIKKNPLNRFVAGSSLGGLMAAIAINDYQEVFSKAGVFSLASWIHENDFLDVVRHTEVKPYSRFYIMVGAIEEYDTENNQVIREGSMAYLNSSINYIKALVDAGTKTDNFELIIDPEGIHCEATWRRNLPEFLKYLHDSK